MKKLSYIYVIFVSIGLCFSQAQARIKISITQGLSQKTPIAVLPFSGNNVKNAYVPKGLSGVIAEDLKNSGRLSPKTGSFPQSIQNSRDISWSKWSENYILVGHISRSGSGYNVSYKLVSKLGNSVISTQIFNHISPSKFRLLAHTISNRVYAALTGRKGYFTTKIAYVDIQNQYNVQRAIYQLIVSDYDGHSPHVLLSQTQEPVLSPTWSKDGQSIAYVSYKNGGMAIYKIGVYTGKVQQVARYKGINSSPVFSPNGRTMGMALSQGYSANTNIYLMNLKNNTLYKKLTRSGINTAPSFSPSGNQIVFVSNRSGNPQVYSVPTSGGQVKRLTFGLKQAFDPHYTPDGRSIIFMYQKSRKSGTQIAKLNLSTSKITVLTRGTLDSSPSVSPDGSMVIYSRGQEGGGANLAMVSIDGNIQINLPSNTKGTIQSPAWSSVVK